MSSSTLEKKFFWTWMACKNAPVIMHEQKLVPGRRFRCDFYHPESKTVIEIEGGAYSGGRHTRGKGFEDDCEKYLLLTLGGFTVIRLSAKQINVPTIERIVKFINENCEVPY